MKKMMLLLEMKKPKKVTNKEAQTAQKTWHTFELQDDDFKKRKTK